MAGFQRAKAEQAAVKMAIYGPPGSGKTFTSLLLAEGLAAAAGKRIAYVDTEHGTDFYCKAVPGRTAHPDAFDFDALYTRSLTEVIAAVKGLDTGVYGVVIIDSITHLWEAAMAAYSGPKTRAGSIPMHAWGRIKKPYKDLMAFLLSSPMHVIFCGRQGVEYQTNEDTDELKAVGVKMKAEGETPYEPHILIRMEAQKPQKTHEIGANVAYAEKDRTGVLAGRSFVNPTYQTLCAPIVGLLSGTQARMETEEEAALKDAEALSQAEQQRAAGSQDKLRTMSARIELADSIKALKDLGKEITPKFKQDMTPADVQALREKYLARELTLKGQPQPVAVPTADTVQ